MQTLFIKLMAISLWCGNVSPSNGPADSNKPIYECRRAIQACLQGKGTTLQMESCFMGTNGGK
jgi:hypothetical protein